jgi:hypothetical protein
MLIREIEPYTPPKKALARQRRFWHDPSKPIDSIGCGSCPERNQCGGLRLNNSLFDCLDLCCHKPNTCDNVCRSNGAFPRRVREIGGFSLDGIPPTAPNGPLNLQPVIPMLYHGSGRRAVVRAENVALPPYAMFNRNCGSPRYSSGEALRGHYGVGESTRVILSGTAKDSPLETWWELGRPARVRIVKSLLKASVSLVTAPNFSLFTDAPRCTDLHSIKRIALVHNEIMSEGLPAALHVNGRTETDFRRWADFLVKHEVST